jgi:uncharacterized protein (TIGR00369 family)
MPLPRRGSKRAASGVALRMDHLTLVEFLQQDRRLFIRKGQVIAMETPASFQALFAPLFPGLMGMEILEAAPERVVASPRVRADLCTTGEILHGGELMAFADTLGVVGTFMNLTAGARTTTVESSTKFIRAAPLGSTVVGECTALHRGRTTTVWQTLVKSDAGKLCGVVTQTQLILPS